MVEKVKKLVFANHKIYSELNICTYNIVAGGGNRLEQVMRCMKMMNMDIGLITETTLQGYHTTLCEGYDIVATKAKSKHQGGVHKASHCAIGSRNSSTLREPELLAQTLSERHWCRVGRSGD